MAQRRKRLEDLDVFDRRNPTQILRLKLCKSGVLFRTFDLGMHVHLECV